MKKTVFLLMFLTGAFSCMAQIADPSLLPADTDPKILACHEWANQVIHAAGQTTTAYGVAGTRQRVLAQSAYRDNQVPRDTTRYFYQANAGSSYNFNSLDYNVGYDILQSQSQWIFNNGYKPDVEMDSLFFYDKALNSQGPDKKVKVSYNADGHILDYKMELYDTAVGIYGHHYINTYNVQGRLRECLQLGILGVQWDTLSRKTFGYNVLGQLISDSSFTYTSSGWRPRDWERLTYNTSGQVTQIDKQVWVVAEGVWKDWGSHKLSYYSDGKVRELLSGELMGTVFVPFYKDSLSYAPGQNFYQHRNIWQAINGPLLEPVSRHTRHLNAQGLPDTATVLSSSSGGGWYVSRKYLLSYDSNNDPVRKITQNTEGDDILVEHYYYELYETPTSIGGATRKEDIRVFPNPAVTQLCMEWANAKPGQQVSVVLYNVSGQLVYSSNLYRKEGVQCIDIAGLHRGVYYMVITDAKGQRLHTQRILKQ